MDWIPELILCRMMVLFLTSLYEANKIEELLIECFITLMSWSMKSNDATRTKETLQIMQEPAPEFSEARVYFVPSFYSVPAMDGQTADHLQNTICEYSRDEILTVMCMGHNRGWEEAASMFSGAPIELKTCNAALLEATGKSWNEAFALAGLGGWKLTWNCEARCMPFFNFDSLGVSTFFDVNKS